jgi:hypothetical protein
LVSPRVPAEIWARADSNIAENVSASTRISNDILFENIDTFGNALGAQRYTEELSRIKVNNAKKIANTAKWTAAEFSAGNNRQTITKIPGLLRFWCCQSYVK